ncbi:MAG TPA: hypothetical protein VIL95_04520 [Bacillota bacterium]
MRNTDVPEGLRAFREALAAFYGAWQRFDYADPTDPEAVDAAIADLNAAQRRFAQVLDAARREPPRILPDRSARWWRQFLNRPA